MFVFEGTHSLARSAVDFIGVAVFHDVLFYAGHRWLLHSAWGYKLLGHDVHHSTRASVALSSMYMAPVDFILEIVIPYGTYGLFFTTDMRINTFTLIVGGLGGLYEHSGYDFLPWITAVSTVAHGKHHRLYNCSYSEGVGSPGLLDLLFKTRHTDYELRFKGRNLPHPEEDTEAPVERELDEDVSTK